jgi:hypothetical protein
MAGGDDDDDATQVEQLGPIRFTPDAAFAL